MPLINHKIRLELNLGKNLVMSIIADTEFKITSTKIVCSNCHFIEQRQFKTAKTIRRRIYWKDLLFIGISTNQRLTQEIYTMTILQDFLLIFLFKELVDCLFLLLITQLLMFLIIKLTILTIKS